MTTPSFCGSQDRRRAVIVISSHVIRGSVGNRSAVFALETLGFPVWAIPTIVLPWHPGHGPSTRMVPNPQQFDAALAELESSPWLGEVEAVLTGYLGAPSQSPAIASLIRAVKQRRPGALYLCDPVIGDEGGLYVPEATARAIRDQLLPLADLTTPNRHELAWLTGHDLSENEQIVKAARMACPENCLITSCHGTATDRTGNLLVTKSSAVLADHPLVDHLPNGPGDLTAAVFLARILSGMTLEKAMISTTSSVFEILSRTIMQGADELSLEAQMQSLSHPCAVITTHQILP